MRQFNVRIVRFGTTFVTAAVVWGGSLYGQGLTGQLSGDLVDPSGASVAGANIQVSNLETGQNRSTKSDNQGHFVFTELLPGNFNLEVDAPGFKRVEQKGINVSSTERVTLPRITMQVGALTDTVSVTGESVVVQTESAERSGLINSRQMQELPLKGRSYMGTAKLIPGIIDTANRESPGWNDLVGININGTRAGSIDLNLDGITSLDTGSLTGPYLAPSIDAVSEVKVLLSNYQAEIRTQFRRHHQHRDQERHERLSRRRLLLLPQ
jgi:hypothetical protein